MVNDNILRIGQGIAGIKFGMSRGEVKKILGRPDEIGEYQQDDFRSETFFYYDLGLNFTFESDDQYRLSYISVNSDRYHFENKIRVGLAKDEVLNRVQELNWTLPVIEDVSSPEFPSHELILFEEKNLHLWLDDNLISEIQFGPFWEDSKTIVWE